MKTTILAIGAALAVAIAALPTAATAQHLGTGTGGAHVGGGAPPGGHIGGGPPGGGGGGVSPGAHMGGGGWAGGGASHFNGGGGPRFSGGEHRFRGPRFAFGFAQPYDAYDYDYYDDSNCYTFTRVWTRYGWRLRRVRVC